MSQQQLMECPPPSEVSGSLWYVGVIICVIAAVVGNTGLVIEKLSLNMEQRRSVDKQRPYPKQPIWLFGFCLATTEGVLDWISFAYAAQTLLSPIGAVTLVSNLLLSRFFLKERLRWTDYLATFLIMFGIALVAITATKDDGCYSIKTLRVLYRRPEFIGYICLLILVLACIYRLIRFSHKMKCQLDITDPRFKRITHYEPVAYGAFSGLIGSFAVLLAKSSMELFQMTFSRGFNQFYDPLAFFIVLFTLITIVGQIHWMAMGMQIYDASLIIPLFQAVYTSGSVVAGAVYFGELNNFNARTAVIFFFGLAFIVGGILLLTTRHKSPDLALIKAQAMGKDAPKSIEKDNSPSDLPAQEENLTQDPELQRRDTDPWHDENTPVLIGEQISELTLLDRVPSKASLQSSNKLLHGSVNSSTPRSQSAPFAFTIQPPPSTAAATTTTLPPSPLRKPLDGSFSPSKRQASTIVSESTTNEKDLDDDNDTTEELRLDDNDISMEIEDYNQRKKSNAVNDFQNKTTVSIV